ncbi:hypothetical protein Gpo141_00002460 [Globisporangium polare]
MASAAALTTGSASAASMSATATTSSSPPTTATTTTTAAAAASSSAATTAAVAALTPALGALEIESLVKQNISTRRELEAWILEQKNSLLLEKTTHEQQTLDHARQTQEAQRKRESLQQQQKTLAAIVHEKESEINAHQVEIEVLQAEKSKKEPVLKELFLRNQEEDQKLKYLVHESTEVQTTQERQLAELQQGLAMYQRLGLFFEHTGANQIIVRFTQIDPNEPTRVFQFRIRIDPVTDRYLVDECNEDVPSFDGLVEDLNSTGDLSFFIRSMRRQFKQLAL